MRQQNSSDQRQFTQDRVAQFWKLKWSNTLAGDTLIALVGQWGNVSFPSWVGGQDPCESTTWENVTCDGNGHVIALNVSNRGIVGTLPDAIGDLAYLQVLDVSNAGDEEFNSLPQNSFSGGIPESLSKLTALRSLNLSSIAWNSSFPNQIVKLANLEEFEISEASITGNVPDDFFSLTKLRVLYLGGNALNVTLADFNKLIQLEELSLFDIRFNATIASDMAEALPKLTFLNVHGCSLYGNLPESLGTLRSLQSLELYKNDLSGVLPAAWSNLQNLTQLRLNENYLSGPFPMLLLTNMPRLSKLYLDDNFFWNDTPSQTVINKTALLRIDCNYLNGIDPQAGNYSAENPYRTRYNCFNGASVSDLNKVVSACKSHIPGKISCDDFYRHVVDADPPGCPPCPVSQSVSPENPASNRCICRYTGDSSSGHSSGNGLPVGAVIGGVLGLVSVFAVVLGYVIWKRRAQFAFLDKFRRSRNGLGDWEAPPGVQRFTLEELSRITNNFSDSHVLGAGGFGKVFYGSLDDGRMVAIKRASPDRLHGLGEFCNEVMLLRLHHRHLVKLEGFCEEGGLEILVYEYMTEGNLHAHLLGKSTSTPLHWYKRLEIAVGIARGLEYLHSFADPPVIHRDVKPSNILLDGNMVAKLADFGISKVTAESETHVTTRPAGTAGYLDPEYFLRRQLTTASDVYAFGVVLLELVTGQEAVDTKRVEEYNLIAWTKTRFRTAGIESIVDPLLDDDYPRDVYTTMTDPGLHCASFNKDDRPSMKVALSRLEAELKAYAQHMSSSGCQPAMRKSRRKASQSPSSAESTSTSEKPQRAAPNPEWPSSSETTQRSTPTDPNEEICLSLLAQTMDPR